MKIEKLVINNSFSPSHGCDYDYYIEVESVFLWENEDK